MLDSLTVRVQNQYFEVENYNKELEEPGGNVINRLELRRKRIRKGTTCSELITSWIMRLNSLPAYYSQLQEIVTRPFTTSGLRLITKRA